MDSRDASASDRLDTLDGSSDDVDKAFIKRTNLKIQEIENEVEKTIKNFKISGNVVLNTYRIFQGNLNLPWILTSYAFEALNNESFGDVLHSFRALGLTDMVLHYSGLGLDDVPVLMNFPLVTKQQLLRLPKHSQSVVAKQTFAVTKDFILTYRPETIIVMHCIFDNPPFLAGEPQWPPPPIGDFYDVDARHLSSTPRLAQLRVTHSERVCEQQIRLVMSRHPQGLEGIDNHCSYRPNTYNREGFKVAGKLAAQAFLQTFDDEYGDYVQLKKRQPTFVGRRNNLVYWYICDQIGKAKAEGKQAPSTEPLRYYPKSEESKWRPRRPADEPEPVLKPCNSPKQQSIVSVISAQSSDKGNPLSAGFSHDRTLSAELASQIFYDVQQRPHDAPRVHHFSCSSSFSNSSSSNPFSSQDSPRSPREEDSSTTWHSSTPQTPSSAMDMLQLSSSGSRHHSTRSRRRSRSSSPCASAASRRLRTAVDEANSRTQSIQGNAGVAEPDEYDRRSRSRRASGPSPSRRSFSLRQRMSRIQGEYESQAVTARRARMNGTSDSPILVE